MKKVWVLTEKQVSKGFMTRRGYKSSGKPMFTKLIPLALRYETKDDAIRGKLGFIEAIEKDIEKNKKIITEATASLTKTYTLTQNFVNEAKEWGIYMYSEFYDSKRQAIVNWDSVSCDPIRQRIVSNVVTGRTQSLAKYNIEKKYITEKICVNEVDMGFRFKVAEKRTITFKKNDCNTYCNVCGGDIPDIDYLMIGWHSKICVLCMSEMMPEIKKHVDEIQPEIKDLWGKERFLKDLG